MENSLNSLVAPNNRLHSLQSSPDIPAIRSEVLEKLPFERYHPHFSPLMVPASSRSVNASSAERSLLLGVIASHLSILDARDNDSRTLRHKSLLWDQVTKKFNSLSSLPRSRHQIQTLYKNMKAKAKKYQLRMMEAQIENAPHAIPEPDPVSELLLQLLAGEHEQRRLHLKQTALNISGELSTNIPVEEDLPEHFLHQELHNPTTAWCAPENGTPDLSIKNEPVDSGQTAIENSLLGEDPLLVRSVSKSPEGSVFVSFPNETEDSPRLASRPDSAENDPSSLSSSPRAEPKRPRLSSVPSCSDQPRNVNQFIRDFNDGIHPLQFIDTRLPTYSGANRQCCCPSLHAELVSMAKEQHEMRLRAAEEERRFRAEQHREKLKLLEMEQELCKRKLKLTEKIISNEKQCENSQDTNASLTLALSQLEKLCNSSISISPLKVSSGIENNGASQDLSTAQCHNELQKLSSPDTIN